MIWGEGIGQDEATGAESGEGDKTESDESRLRGLNCNPNPFIAVVVLSAPDSKSPLAAIVAD